MMISPVSFAMNGRKPSPTDLKRARELDAALYDLLKALHEAIESNDAIDDAYMTLLSLDTWRR